MMKSRSVKISFYCSMRIRIRIILGEWLPINIVNSCIIMDPPLNFQPIIHKIP